MLPALKCSTIIVPSQSFSFCCFYGNGLAFADLPVCPENPQILQLFRGFHVFFPITLLIFPILPSTVDFSAQEEYPVSLLHGHRQVTDFHLLLLARSNDAILVTLDGKLVKAVKGTKFEDYVLHALSYCNNLISYS